MGLNFILRFGCGRFYLIRILYSFAKDKSLCYCC